MTSPHSIAFVRAAPSQEAAFNELVLPAIRETFPAMSDEATATLLASVRLVVHADVGFAASARSLSVALEDSPVFESAKGDVTLLAGANDVTAHVADTLSLIISNNDATLLIPHEFALESEIRALSARIGITMQSVGEHVYQRFMARDCAPKSIYKALGSTIPMHSVCWAVWGR